jgi:hypothetical protein
LYEKGLEDDGHDPDEIAEIVKQYSTKVSDKQRVIHKDEKTGWHRYSAQLGSTE